MEKKWRPNQDEFDLFVGKGEKVKVSLSRTVKLKLEFYSYLELVDMFMFYPMRRSLISFFRLDKLFSLVNI